VVIYFGLLVVICFERLAELVVSQRHASQSLGSGGVESGQGHFPVMVALHAALLAGCWIEPIALHRTFIPALGWPMFALVIGANSLRWWCIAALGPRWSARVIVMPGVPLVTAGPYRYLSMTRRETTPRTPRAFGFNHPNYVAVIVEGAALPLMGSAWITAATFTAANLALLTVRIRCESRALAAAPAAA
jgi:methyltransferase